MKLAILATHPIQYQAPLFRALAAHPELDVKVYFCARDGAAEYFDAGFGRRVQWDVPLLEGYDHEFLPNWSPRPNPSRFAGVINPQIVARLRRDHPDALLLQGWSRTTEWIAMLAAFTTGIPVLFRTEAHLLRPPRGWRRVVKQAILPQALRRVHTCLAIGTLNYAFYRAYGVDEHRILQAPYAVDNDFFTAAADRLAPRRDALREKHGVPGAAPIILFAGKLIPQKAPMDLLRAFARAGAGARLVYVGDGALRDLLEKEAQALGVAERVIFAGFRNQSELPEWYALSDVFALPSTYETWGLVVNEAMCYGLPIVASDSVGAAADLVDRENGAVFPTGDVDELAKQLTQILSDPEGRTVMGKRSRARIEAWSYRENVDAIVEAVRRARGGAP